MWRLIEYLAVAGIILLAITEFFYPLIAGKPFFGSFRKNTKNQNNVASESPLNEKVNKAKEKVEEIRAVQNEVNEHYKSAEQLKEEADQLLNKSKDRH